MPNLIIGSRGSRLALWQAEHIKAEIERAHPGLVVAIEIIKTTGDKLTEASLAQIGGKGVFTKEIEEALLDERIDLAVHSLKDLPTTLPDGLHLAAITEREDVRDALIVRGDLATTVKSIKDLPQGARVGTSSLRRAAQLRAQRPDLSINELRGNVETRLRKLDEGEHDAIILAAAGLKRLGYAARITALLEADEMLSAVGQGALGIETRIDDARTNLLLDFLNHWPTRQATEAERAVLRELGGGCAVPIAALGRINADGDKLMLEALVADVNGKQMLRQRAEGAPARGEEIGAELAQRLAKLGARDLLPRLGGQSDSATPRLSSPASPVTQQPTQPKQQTRAATVPDTSPNRSANAPTITAPTPENRRAPKTAKPTVAPKPTTKPASDASAADSAPRQSPSSIRAAVSELMRKRRKEAEQRASREQLAVEENKQATEGTERTEEKPTTPPARTVEIAEPSPPASVPSVSSVAALPPVPLVSRPTQKPLAGRRVIVTRSIKQSGEITRALEHFGAEVIACPTIEIKPPTTWDALDRALIHLSWYDWLVFTSANGVGFFLQRLDELGHGRAELMSHRVCAVGRKTAAKLKSEGLTVDLVPERFTAEALVEAFLKTFGVRYRLRGSRMLLPTARVTRDVIRPAMEKIGVHVELVEAYQTVLPATANAEVAQTLREAQADYIIFTSPSTVANLAALLETDDLAQYLRNTRVACIGPVTAEAAQGYGLTVRLQPEEHTSQAIVLAIVADNTDKAEDSAKHAK